MTRAGNPYTVARLSTHTKRQTASNFCRTLIIWNPLSARIFPPSFRPFKRAMRKCHIRPSKWVPPTTFEFLAIGMVAFTSLFDYLQCGKIWDIFSKLFWHRPALFWLDYFYWWHVQICEHLTMPSLRETAAIRWLWPNYPTKELTKAAVCYVSGRVITSMLQGSIGNRYDTLKNCRLIGDGSAIANRIRADLLALQKWRCRKYY